jgi:hypothetical protein
VTTSFVAAPAGAMATSAHRAAVSAAPFTKTRQGIGGDRGLRRVDD